MNLSISEKIKIILGRRNMTLSELAKKLGTSRQNLTNKMTRNNFSERDVRQIADVLNCDYDSLFTFRDTGETL